MTADENEIVITRTFHAPRKLVWDAWTDPRHIAAWWGPEGFQTRVEGVDLRPGGRWSYVMIGPDGAEYPVCGVFREIVPLERIVTTDEFGEDFVAPEGVDLPQGIVMTCLFEDAGPGIPPPDRERVFERFARAGGRKEGTGSGLGLSIVAQTVHNHGGSVWSGEAPTGGAGLVIRLPLVSEDHP